MACDSPALMFTGSFDINHHRMTPQQDASDDDVKGAFPPLPRD